MSFASLSGKTVLVTGGARGIGKGLARACIAEGARVIITNRDAASGRAAALELGAPHQVRSIACDGTVRAQVDALLDDIWATEGPLDLVFSNAGTGGKERALTASMAEIQAIMATNFETAVHLAQACVPRMQAAAKPAHIMFTASEHALSLPAGNGDLGFAYYGVSKHAMHIFAEWLRADLAGSNVSVSLLLPGPVLTEGVQSAFQQLERDPEHPAIRAVFSKTVEELLRARAISTDTCAQRALTGLRAGLFYIPTQPHLLQDVDLRHQELTAAFARMGLQA